MSEQPLGPIAPADEVDEGYPWERNGVTFLADPALVLPVPSINVEGFVMLDMRLDSELTPDELTERNARRAEGEARRAQWQREEDARNAERRARYAATEAPEPTLAAILEELDWSPAYARHRVHPLCTCDERYAEGGTDLCQYAEALGFTHPSDTP